MKTYKRNELKDIFQKELNNIKVTNKLKDKTLLNISKQHKTSIYYLRNCAAVLLVSCICLSLNLKKNSFFYKKNIPLESMPQDTNLKTEEFIPKAISSEEQKMRAYSPENYQRENTPVQSYKTPISTNTLIDYGLSSTMLDISQPAETSSIITESSKTNERLTEIKVGDTVENLLQYYPNLQKSENTYTLITQNCIITYHVNNGIITNISEKSNN